MESRERRGRGSGRWSDIQSRKRIKGDSYSTRLNKLKPRKRMASDLGVTCKCRFQCSKVSLAMKMKLFQAYYNVNTKSQGTFLMNNMSLCRVNRRRIGRNQDPASSRRQATIKYSLPSTDGELRVCKKTFMNTFDVGEKKVRILIDRLKAGETFFSDRRTSHKPAKYSDETKEAIWSHIKSLPVEESHYSRKKTSKLYLSRELNMKRLHVAFKEKFPQYSNVKYLFYRKIFRNDFPNYAFARPRTDTCRTCDLLAAKVKTTNSDLLRRRLQKNLRQHHMKAENAMDVHRQKIAESKMPGSKFCNMAIDLQQVMFVPTLTHSDMFYQRQLSCYNFGVNISDSGQSYMCMWSELVAGRGGNEVISCIFHILNDPSIIHKNNIVIWSDNCVGQHKNKMAVMMYMLLVANGVYHSIEHRFLVSGHSFLPCDRDFALIEKRKKVCNPIIPSDLHDLVRSAKTTVPFKIIDMVDKPFFDFSEPAKKLLSAEKLKIKTVAGIKVTKKSIEDGILFTKQRSKGAWKPVKVLRKNVTVHHVRAITLTSIEHSNRISAEKKNDLLSMVEFLKEDSHKKFYLDNLT